MSNTPQHTLELNPQGQLITANGQVLTPPEDWQFLPAGDAGLTRKVSAAGPYWRVQFHKGRRTMAKGIWAPAEHIEAAKAALAAQRADPAYCKKRAADLARRKRQQEVYEQEFYQAVRAYLAFHPCYHPLEHRLARAVTAHAVPVGSGTVARTARIPLAERAAHAVIAWMRHQTTAYESMQIARIKGERRKIRRLLAQRSAQLLQHYREGLATPESCPLHQALAEKPAQPTPPGI